MDDLLPGVEHCRQWIPHRLSFGSCQGSIPGEVSQWPTVCELFEVMLCSDKSEIHFSSDLFDFANGQREGVRSLLLELQRENREGRRVHVAGGMVRSTLMPQSLGLK